MSAVFIHDGEYLDHLPAVDIPLGAVVVLSDSIGIAVRAIPAGSLGGLAMEGVFDLPRAAGALIPKGKHLAWDPATQQVTDVLATVGAIVMGIAAADSLAGAVVVRVRLNH